MKPRPRATPNVRFGSFSTKIPRRNPKTNHQARLPTNSKRKATVFPRHPEKMSATVKEIAKPENKSLVCEASDFAKIFSIDH